MYANKQNTKAAFGLVKEHILDLQSQIYELRMEQARLRNRLNEGNGCQQEALIVAATGTKVHIESCPFAKNIHPKNKVVFVSKEEALNKGYKPCECMKKV